MSKYLPASFIKTFNENRSKYVGGNVLQINYLKKKNLSDKERK